MDEITVETTREDPASKSLQVTVATARVQAAEARAVRRYAAGARLPGFRKGKAPESVVRKRFGEAIRTAVLDELIRESWEHAKRVASLRPVADPTIRNLRFEDGAPLEFELVVDVRPELTLERIGGFDVTRRVSPVSAEDVQERLQQLQTRKAAWLPVEDASPTAGQMVRVDVSRVEGETVQAAEPHTIVLGEGMAIPALEERIMQLKPGETAEVDIQLPDDHPEESKRGQLRRLRVTLHEVKRRELPPLDDALAREAGDFETLAELREAVEADLRAAAGREADGGVRDQLVQAIVEANGVTAPPSLVERFLRAYAEAYDVPEERYEAFAGEFRPLAEAQVRRDLVLDALVEAHKLSASEADLDARIAQMAEARKVSPGQLYASLQKSDRLRDLERSVTEDKVFTFLLQQSTVEEVSS